ncbi:G protein alpha subunit [Choanephora cucurbitarum]|nr:G protein alpha subunit [Choanephora cucurbitarum]
MGCCASVEEPDSAGKLRNEEIDGQLRMEKINHKNEVKLLLLGKVKLIFFLFSLLPESFYLGAGESGKSTILKQMKLIHDGGFTPDEKEAYREIIFSNTIQSIQVLLEAMVNLEIALANPDNQPYLDYMIDQNQQSDQHVLSPEVVKAIQNLWADEGVREVYSRRNEFQLNDSASYYFDSIERIGDSGYLPTDQDVLRSRVKTTGIAETKFVFDTLTYRMLDVGGQRSERKKWIHCFEDVTAIIFLVAISEYDQVLVEDESVNRMQEALTLFDSICNSRWFEKTSTILFLNKIDLFKQKLPHTPLSDYFPDYKGDNYEQASKYLMQRFVSLNSSVDKQVYTHLTCATDTEQIRFVMTAVNDIILQANLRENGLI